MNLPLRITTLIALAAGPCLAAPSAHIHFLTFPKSDLQALGKIESLRVTVDCSWIASLKDVPELYNIEMHYDMPTQNLLEARPRLGAAAVGLKDWSSVIGVRVPTDADARSCFAVSVTAEGRYGVSRTWQGKQLGIPE